MMMARMHLLLSLSTSITMVVADPVVYLSGVIDLTFPGPVTQQDLQTVAYQNVLASAFMNLTGAPAGSVTTDVVLGPATTTAAPYTGASTTGPNTTADPTTTGPNTMAGPNRIITAAPYNGTSTTGPNTTTGPTYTGPSTTADPHMIITAAPYTGPSTTGPTTTTGPTYTGPSTTVDPHMISTKAPRRLAVYVRLRYNIKTTKSKAAAIQTQLSKAKAQFGTRLAGVAETCCPAIALALGSPVVHNAPTALQSATTLPPSKANTTMQMPLSKANTTMQMKLSADGAQAAATLSGILVLMLSAVHLH